LEGGRRIFTRVYDLMPERFVSEPIKPLTETADTSRMAIGNLVCPVSSVGGVGPLQSRRF